MGRDYSSDEPYDTILKTAVGLAAAASPAIILAPGADLIAMAGVWGGMATEIASKNGIRLEKKEAGRIMLAVATGLGAYVGGSKIFLTIVGKIPGIGMLGASAANATANSVLTIWLGFTLIDLFEDSEMNLEGHVEFIIKAINPKGGMAKMGARTVAFIKRGFRRK